MIYAVDFDGLLCEDAYPEIGAPKTEIIEHFKALKAQGHKLILWTCREGEKLEEAIRWCAEHGLTFDAHNANLPELTELYGNDCRKVGADYYCDDRNYTPQESVVKGVMTEQKRCCENCGNTHCANSIVAYNWDACVDSNFTKHWMPKKEAQHE